MKKLLTFPRILNVRKVLTILALMVSVVPGYSQEETQMADVMRSNGKIYVVVAIMLILLVGLTIYLFLVDRKVTNLERKFEDNK